jgi:hypothetical protein
MNLAAHGNLMICSLILDPWRSAGDSCKCDEGPITASEIVDDANCMCCGFVPGA